MNKNIQKEIDGLADEDLWLAFGRVKELLITRGLARTRNMVGERGEFLAVSTYKLNTDLPNLMAAPEGTQNIDAISRRGERYSIKTVTFPNTQTGVFYGLGDKDDEISETKFEYVIVVELEKDFSLKRMFEYSWEDFVKIKSWHTTMRGWAIRMTKSNINIAKLIYSKSKSD